MAWGDNGFGQCTVPAPNSDFTAIAAGAYHSLGLKADGTVVAWGQGYEGQCAIPAPNSGYIAVSGGAYHSLGLKSSSPVDPWESNDYGQDVVPALNSGYKQVSGGTDFNLGLKNDGSITGWGRNDSGQCTPAVPNSGYIRMAAGDSHGLGLRSDSSIAGWGWNWWGQITSPAPNSGYISVDGGWTHSLGLKSDGSIAAWGDNRHGACDVPTPNSGFKAVAAGSMFNLGLKADGTVVAWGYNLHGQCDVPAPNSGFKAVAAGGYNSCLGLKADGTIVGWGSNYKGQLNVPAPNSGFTAIAAGANNGLAIRDEWPDPTITAIDPDYAHRGQSLTDVEVTGTFFRGPDANLSVELRLDTEVIEATNVRFINSTTVRCGLDIPEDATTGSWDVHVAHADDGKTCTLPGGFEVDYPDPHLDGIAPDEGKQGDELESVVIIGRDFRNPPGGIVAGIRQGVNVVNGRNVRWISPTRIQFDLDLAPLTPTGAWDVFVTHSDDGKTGTLPGAFTVNPPTPPARDWYLAEGCTRGGMETWVLVQNPNATDVTVDLTFMTSAGPLDGPRGFPIEAGSRHTFKANDYVTDWNVSTRVTSTGDVICERACYGNERTWAHDSIGSTSAAPTWYLAEGCTEGGMETWVLVQNPNATDVTVDLTFMTSAGPLDGPRGFPIEAGSRHTFKANDYVTDWNVSTRVTSTGDVICERACYGNERTWAHDSIGSTSAAPTWYLAEGCTEGGMETWVLVQNPNATDVTVDLTFMTSAEPRNGPQGFRIEAGSRHTFNLSEYVKDWNLSTRVTSSGGDVICERAMYGNERQWAHDSVGYAP